MANYFDMPIVDGIGAGAGFEAQAPRLSEAAAKTAKAAILTNFMKYFPSFPCWKLALINAPSPPGDNEIRAGRDTNQARMCTGVPGRTRP